MDVPPPFKVHGNPGGEFFALAFVPVRYVHNRVPNEAACLTLYFSTSADFSRFTLMTIAADGVRLSYHRGDEFLSSLEYAILSASVHDAIPPRS